MVPEGWTSAKLADLCSKPISYGIVQTGEKGVGSIPCVRVVDLTQPKISRDDMITTTSEISRSYKKTILESEEIMLALRGEIGLVRLVPEELVGCNLTRGIARISAKKSAIDPNYLLRQIQSQSFRRDLLRRVNGSALQEIPLGELRNVRVAIAPLAEQKKIAEILSTWDRAIDVADAQLANARKQKRALMQSLLTGKRRFPEFAGQKWREVRFEDVFSRVRRKNTVGNDNVLTISAQHGLVSQEHYFNKRVAAQDLSGYTFLQQGDFAYNKSYSQGYPLGAIKMLESDQPGVVSSLYLCFALSDATQYSREFFRHYFEAGCFNREIYKIAQEGARNHGLLNVSATDFFRAQLHIPELEEQRMIARTIGTAEVQEEIHRREILRLKTEKKALMQQLLTGKRRVTG